jgi:hypothetical protein
MYQFMSKSVSVPITDAAGVVENSEMGIQQTL